MISPRTLSLACLGSLLVLGAVQADTPRKSWDTFRASQRAEVASLPKPPQPPPGEGSALDRFLAAYWKKQGYTPPAPVDERTFARRVYFDVIGLPPTPQQLQGFLADRSPDKRAKLVDRLLAEKEAYAEHWMTYWNDLLRNDEQTNIDGLRKPVTTWLYPALLENRPLDQMVFELLNPGPNGPDGYLKGVNWRGRVNASQTPPIQAAQNVGQVFLASALKCASCHNSFINKRKLAEAYGLASFFTPQNLEIHRCDKPTGVKAAPVFLFPDLGTVDPKADLNTRRQAVATMVTRPRNPRFARAMVNRLWKRLLGEGILEPADDFDSVTLESPLLDWLAYDFMAHDYNAKHMLRTILLSRIYQLPVPPANPKKKTPLLGPTERRLTSEQYLDAVAQLTGYWPGGPAMQVRVANPHMRTWRHKKPDALTTALGRPNREQVCTERSQESTVLQALELVNGRTLAERLQAGAKTLLASELGRQENGDEVARVLYLRALGRIPTAEEVALVKPLLGTPKEKNRQEGWEDVLWVLVNNPEFQFVR